MFCSKCGAKNDDNRDRCLICGTTLMRPPEMQDGAAPPTPSSPPAAVAPPSPPPAIAAPMPASAPPLPAPNSYLVPAILTTLFCCLPFGIVAIVYAASVTTKWQTGDRDGALRASASARTWCWVTFGIGLAFFLLYAVGIAVAAISGM